jgi:hypothetical protein
LTHPLALCYDAIKTKLLTNTTIAASGGIWQAPAPEGTPYPLYTFELVSDPGDTVSKRRNFDLRFLITCWGSTPDAALDGIGLVDDTLHNQELSISNWSNWKCINAGFVQLPSDLDAGEVVYRHGVNFDIAFDQNG